MRELQPDVVIHAQALSDVDRCELDPGMAEEMNVRTTAHVVEALEQTTAWLVQISTDYVFDGTKGSPYDETDEPNPLSVYGKTKLASERLALARERSVVVRPSTLFGPDRMNFCDEIVMRLREGQRVEAFKDQTTSPTYTEDLAEALTALVQRLQREAIPSRILHVANQGGCTRLEFAQRIADLAGYPRERIEAIRMAQQRRPAPRPACSALTSRYASRMIGRTLRPWDDALQAYLRQRR